MSSDFQIRPVAAPDRDAVEALWSALHEEQERLDERFSMADDARQRWRNDFQGWLRGTGRWMWVAEREERIVGFLTAERNYLPPIYRAVNELFLTEIFVLPEARRLGVGRALVEKAIALASEEEVERIRLIALSKNDVSHAFWRSFGAAPFSETLLLQVGEPTDAPRPRRFGF